MPSKLRDLKRVNFSEATEEDKAMFKEYADWKIKMLEGVCSACVLDMYLPSVGGFDALMKEFEGWDQKTVVEWIRSMHELRTGCDKHGVSTSYFSVMDIDEMWIRTFSQDLYNKVFEESQVDTDTPTGYRNQKPLVE